MIKELDKVVVEATAQKYDKNADLQIHAIDKVIGMTDETRDKKVTLSLQSDK